MIQRIVYRLEVLILFAERIVDSDIGGHPAPRVAIGGEEPRFRLAQDRKSGTRAHDALGGGKIKPCRSMADRHSVERVAD
jgi:hypothetical protein